MVRNRDGMRLKKTESALGRGRGITSQFDKMLTNTTATLICVFLKQYVFPCLTRA